MPKKKRGRPEFKPTSAMRRRVSIGAAGGMTHDELAVALNIARATLEKHFERELSVGAHQRRLDALVAMYDTATGAKGLKPNVSAQKAFVAAGGAIEIAVPPADEQQQSAGKAAAAPPEKPLGKKEQQQQDAANAHVGSNWANLLKPGATPQ
jgi:hypothetical protein